MPLKINASLNFAPGRLPCLLDADSGLKIEGLISAARDFPGDSVVKEESCCQAGDMRLIPWSGRSPGEEMTTHSSILA